MIYNYDSINAFLSDELRRRMRMNPRYSLRSFARSLRLSPGALSEILRGQRDLSLKAVPHIANAMGLSSAEALHLLQLAQLAKAAKDKALKELEQKAAQHEHHVLNEELFSLISEWYHFAILNLLEVEGFQWDTQWIAGRLGISRLQAKMAMDLLSKMGLVVRKNGRYHGKESQILAKADIPSAAIRSYHRQILEKAILALESQSMSEREFTGTGFAVDLEHLPAIKKELGEFQDRLLAKYAKGKKSEVYFLELALFKLTQGDRK